jgi:hypothetical protein
MKNSLRIMLFFSYLFLTQVSAQDMQNNAKSKLLQNLNTIENLYLKYLNPSEQRDAVRLLNETRNIIIGDNVALNLKVDYSGLNVLNDASYKKLLESLKKEGADFNKTKLIQAIGKNGKITCEQLDGLISTYSFDSYKIELLKAISGNIIDPVNIGVVLSHFDSVTSRDEMVKYFQNM